MTIINIFVLLLQSEFAFFLNSLFTNVNTVFHKLHGYTMHQQYPTLYFPTDAHNIKKHRVIKTF